MGELEIFSGSWAVSYFPSQRLDLEYEKKITVNSPGRKDFRVLENSFPHWVPEGFLLLGSTVVDISPLDPQLPPRKRKLWVQVRSQEGNQGPGGSFMDPGSTCHVGHGLLGASRPRG